VAVRVILAIDTVGPVAGVAARVGARVAVREERIARGAETRLPKWIAEVCAELGGSPGDIRGVGVAVGPGAFTGLRVGIAAATGLALALGAPVWPCDGLRTRAAGAGAGLVLSVLDARKGRFYAARYRDGAVVAAPADLTPEQALADLAPPFSAVGEGAIALEAAITARGGRVVAGADRSGVLALAALAQAAIAAGEGCDPALVRPLYLREPDAIPTAERRTGWT
jgi:tRNA threonylcarbamoyladenosine biosynthesis protein TsaB